MGEILCHVKLFTLLCSIKLKQTTKTRDMSWTIEYTNDVGPNDESFYEWWEVTNGSKAFKCNTEEDAKWLLKTIDLNKELLEALKAIKEIGEFKADGQIGKIINNAINKATI